MVNPASGPFLFDTSASWLGRAGRLDVGFGQGLSISSLSDQPDFS